MFSGIGGFEKGIEDATKNRRCNWEKSSGRCDLRCKRRSTNIICELWQQQQGFNPDWHCVGYSEIDKYATAIYKYHYPGHTNYGDCRAIEPNGLPDFDLIVGGFPCQSFSIAGKRGGFEDTRGTLFFEIARIARVKRPGYLFLENVKGLLSSKAVIDLEEATFVLRNELMGGTLWEKEFTPVNRWIIFGNLIRSYLVRKFRKILDYENHKPDMLSTNYLRSAYEKREIEVGNGLTKRLIYCATQIRQILKKQYNYQIEQKGVCLDNVGDLDSLLNSLITLENIRQMDIGLTEKIINILKDAGLLLSYNLVENFMKQSLSTTSTETSQTIDQKIYMYANEIVILLFIIKHWKLSSNLWKRVSYPLIEKEASTFYVNAFSIILGVLDELGYDCQWHVLNSKNHGVPQNRERVFIIGHFRGKPRPKVFPIGETNEIIDKTKKLPKQYSNTLGTNYSNGKSNETYVGELIYQGAIMTEKNKKWLEDGKELSRNFPQGQRVYSAKGIATNLSSNAGGPGAKTGLYATNKSSVRRLTPIECERLQGFPDGWTKYGLFDGQVKEISDTQRYKCLGNAVTTNVIKDIVSEWIK